MEKETYLTFVLGNEVFAVNVKKVLEVLEQQYITPVPQMPVHIRGIINFRGEILPVIDTRRKFALSDLSTDKKFYVIVFDISTEEKHFTIAATADAVRDVIEIDPQEIKPVPEIGLNYDARFISGAIFRNEGFTLLVEIEKVFSLDDKQTVLVQQEINQ